METNSEQLMDRLLGILRRMARTARNSQWMGMSEEADQYSVDQFNRILERLKAVDTSGAHEVFAPLPQGCPWSSLGNACRDLIACYETETRGDAFGCDDRAHEHNHEHEHRHGRDRDRERGRGRGFWTDAKSGIWIDKEAFLHGMPREMNEFGEFIVEKIGEWQRRARAKAEER